MGFVRMFVYSRHFSGLTGFRIYVFRTDLDDLLCNLSVPGLAAPDLFEAIRRKFRSKWEVRELCYVYCAYVEYLAYASGRSSVRLRGGRVIGSGAKLNSSRNRAMLARWNRMVLKRSGASSTFSVSNLKRPLGLTFAFQDHKPN